jgi:C-terminal processing protease CtpA/Prc
MASFSFSSALPNILNSNSSSHRVSSTSSSKLTENNTNNSNNKSLSRSISGGAGDKLKRLRIKKKENSFLHRESTSKLNEIKKSIHITTNNGTNNNNKNNNNSIESNNHHQQQSNFLSHIDNQCLDYDYEEIKVTIRKSERGFGFELKNGIHIVRVVPNTPAHNSGILANDIILKINGTCVRTKDQNEISNMINECKFVLFFVTFYFKN